jgi:RNA recognition motif-containing protein
MDIFIGNLHPNITEEHLRLLFESFGRIISTNIAKHSDTGLSRCFGFVRFDEVMDALNAIDDMNGRELSGKPMVVKKAISKEEKQTSWQQEDSGYSNNYRQTRTEIDDDGWARVNFEREDYHQEKIDLEVKDESEFSKKVLKDGYIQITFKK